MLGTYYVFGLFRIICVARRWKTIEEVQAVFDDEEKVALLATFMARHDNVAESKAGSTIPKKCFSDYLVKRIYVKQPKG